MQRPASADLLGVQRRSEQVVTGWRAAVPVLHCRDVTARRDREHELSSLVQLLDAHGGPLWPSIVGQVAR